MLHFMPNTSPIERRVLFAQLKPECRQEYIEAHKNVWPELLERYKEIGYHKITCHLFGTTLAVVVEAEHVDVVMDAAKSDAIDKRWQDWMATLRPAGDQFQPAENVFEVNL